MRLTTFSPAIALDAFAIPAWTWDYEGLHAINELALASLPANFERELQQRATSTAGAK